ncbi:MAG: glycosyltransferase [Bernardetiaceae bacterium]|nr:glycosyltransferase [Bernardetiaceae bacterium]
MAIYPKISVVVPSYNQADFIEETLQSILNQRYPHLELIVIDGGSKDGSVEIIQKYEKYITYWVSEADRGQSHAINKGFERATGELLTWLCSDDLYTENALFKVVAHFNENPQADLVHGKTQILTQGKRGNITAGFHRNWELDYFSHMAFPQPSSFFRRQIIDQIGLTNEALHYTMDYDLMLRMQLADFTFLPVDDLLSCYRHHPDSKSIGQRDAFDPERQVVFSKLMRSIDYPQGINTLKEAELLRDSEGLYQVKRNFSENFKKQILLNYLNNMLINTYNNQNMAQVCHIGKAIDALDATSLDKHENRSRYNTAQYQQASWIGKLRHKIGKVLK